MSDTLIHCKYCGENIPIMEFDISYHAWGDCKQLPQKEYEKLDFRHKYSAEISLFFFLGVLTASVYGFSMLLAAMGVTAFWVLGIMIGVCIGFIIYANLKLRANDSSPSPSSANLNKDK